MEFTPTVWQPNGEGPLLHPTPVCLRNYLTTHLPALNQQNADPQTPSPGPNCAILLRKAEA